MKSLADFKRVIQSCIVNSIMLKSTVFDKNGAVIRENDFTTVNHIQSNSFSLNRNGKQSWMEFGKASEWSFIGGNSTRQFGDGGKIIFELSNPEFFGL